MAAGLNMSNDAEMFSIDFTKISGYCGGRAQHVKRRRSVLHRFHEDFRVLWLAQNVKNEAEVFSIDFTKILGYLPAQRVINDAAPKCSIVTVDI